MADNMTPVEMDPGAGTSSKGLGGLLSSRTGKLALGGALLVLVLAIAAGAFFLFFGGSSGSDEVAQAPAPSGAPQAAAQSAPATATPSSEITVTPVEPAEVPLTDVFTFRDIFDPLAKAPATTSGGSGSGTPGGSDTNSTPQASANTILLQDITSENGEPQAVLVWDGTTYTVGEGDQVGSSPWQVLDIRTDSVIMLYGDVQVPLSIGQSITK